MRCANVRRNWYSRPRYTRNTATISSPGRQSLPGIRKRCTMRKCGPAVRRWTISATSRSTLLRTDDILFFAGIACPHPFDLELKVNPKWLSRGAEEERHLKEPGLQTRLLQVVKGCKPGSRTASHAENHDVATMLPVSQSCRSEE